MIGTVVLPNQQLVFNEADNIVYKTLVAKPVAADPKAPSLAFAGQPAAAIFAALQSYYGIPILYEPAALSSCLLTIDIRNKSFYDGLNAICAPLHASYEVIDGTVLIAGAGCK